MSRHSDYRDALAQCPYYKGQDAHNIYCEGLTPFGGIRVFFRREREREKWVRDKCNSIKDCEECPIHRGKSEE